MITIELYGIPRLRAGLSRFLCEAATVRDALEALVAACPALDGSVVSQNRPLPEYRLSVNGDRFVDDPDTALRPGDALLLLSADVGG